VVRDIGLCFSYRVVSCCVLVSIRGWFPRAMCERCVRTHRSPRSHLLLADHLCGTCVHRSNFIANVSRSDVFRPLDLVSSVYCREASSRWTGSALVDHTHMVPLPYRVCRVWSWIHNSPLELGTHPYEAILSLLWRRSSYPTQSTSTVPLCGILDQSERDGTRRAVKLCSGTSATGSYGLECD